MGRILTIGYQGATIDAFIATLENAGVDLLADVRAAPVSRIPGFSKHALADAAGAAGIAYRHVAALGNPLKRPGATPTPGRDFRTVYRAHLETPPARAALEDLLALAASGRPCLMCMERDVAHCHRALIVARLLELDPGLRVEHLTVSRPGPDRRQMGLDL